MILFETDVTKNDATVGKEFLLFVANHYIYISFSESNSLLKLQATSSLSDILIAHKNIVFLSTSNEFTILPQSLSTPNEVEKIVKFLKWSNSSKIEKNELIGCQSEILYSDNTFEDTAAKIPSLILEHIHLKLYQFCLTQNWENGIGVLVLENNLFICIFKDNKFTLCNTFSVSSNDEISYYIMLMFQEFGLSQEDTSLELFGEIDEKPFLEKHLSQYIRNIYVNQSLSVANMKYSGLVALLEK